MMQIIGVNAWMRGHFLIFGMAWFLEKLREHSVGTLWRGVALKHLEMSPKKKENYKTKENENNYWGLTLQLMIIYSLQITNVLRDYWDFVGKKILQVRSISTSHLFFFNRCIFISHDVPSIVYMFCSLL